MNRDRAKELLPDWVTGRLSDEEARAVEARARAEPALQVEAELLRTLAAARPEAPDWLGQRVRLAVREAVEEAAPGRQRASWPGVLRLPIRTPVWGWAAAAVIAALALGTNLMVDGPPHETTDPVVGALALERAPILWGEDDGFVAGAPLLSGLSDEALESLLRELGG
ncbi:MAG TPA: hypothetical protein VGA70_00395 [Longimicrobiales bacterium]|jgi:anti-sigma factor RsiW